MMSAKAVSSGDIKLDEAVDAKGKEEEEIEAIMGQFTCLEDIAQGDPVAVPPRREPYTLLIKNSRVQCAVH